MMVWHRQAVEVLVISGWRGEKRRVKVRGGERMEGEGRKGAPISNFFLACVIGPCRPSG